MLLPDKAQVHRSQILERKIDIEQGKKLSSKLDELRRLVADEEANFKKARERSVELMKKEIAEWVHKRDQAKKEYEEMQNAVDAPKKDLEKRKKTIEEAEEKLNRISERLAETARNFDLRSKQLKMDEDAIAEALKNAKIALDDAEHIQKQALSEAKQSRTASKDREMAADKKFGEADDRLEAVSIREKKAEEREKILTGIAANLVEEQHKLSLRERDIIDREETLKREATRRLKKIIN